jgi:pyrroline-5-carboxylate reductase
MMPLPDFPSETLIFGCGNMGSAMLRGWLATGIRPAQFTIVDPSATDLPEGVYVHRAATEIDRKFDTVLLGIKPQMLETLAPEISRMLAPNALVISILAGSRSSSLESVFPGARIARLMPNLAAAIGKSPLGLFSDNLDEGSKEQLDSMLAPLGLPIWLNDEAGPAFVYRFIDALAYGGSAMGLPHDIAAKLALATVEGAAQLAAISGEGPAQLAARVTSPGGTTAAGLSVLDSDGALQKLLEATLHAARDRSVEMAKGG